MYILILQAQSAPQSLLRSMLAKPGDCYLHGALFEPGEDGVETRTFL